MREGSALLSLRLLKQFPASVLKVWSGKQFALSTVGGESKSPRSYYTADDEEF